MSVGGRIIENIRTTNGAGTPVRRLWVVDRDGTETAVYAELAAWQLRPGEEIWWQSGQIMARGDKLVLRKIGFSFDPAQAGTEGGK